MSGHRLDHRLPEPWGEGVIYPVHRPVSLFAVGLAVDHPVIMVFTHPDLPVIPTQLGDVPRGAVAAFVSVGAARHAGGDGALAGPAHSCSARCAS